MNARSVSIFRLYPFQVGQKIYIADGPRRGGWGGGFAEAGRGWRNMFYATGQPGWMRYGGHLTPHGYPLPFFKPDADLEKHSLKNQAEVLQAELDLIKKRLAEVEAGSAKE